MTPRFYFATCQVGAEKAVKNEISFEHPDLRFAFSRPGLITFKEESNSKPPRTLTKNIFTRLWGEVIDQIKDPAKLNELLAKIPNGKIAHAFERDTFVPGDEPDNFVLNEHVEMIVKSAPQIKWNAAPAVGEDVYDLIWADGFHVFLGKHIHHAKLSPAPGNIPKISLPIHSPARSYLKIEEAIYRFNPEIQKGMSVVEVGCSPGGATMAMLEKGLLVTGIDPKFMHEKIYTTPGFKFIQKCARDVTNLDLGTVNPDWVVMDMNIAPLEALDELTHVLLCLRKNHGKNLKVKQGFITIKLNDWKFAESIPLYLRRLSEMGFLNLTSIQLCSNRQEFFVHANGFKI